MTFSPQICPKMIWELWITTVTCTEITPKIVVFCILYQYVNILWNQKFRTLSSIIVIFFYKQTRCHISFWAGCLILIDDPRGDWKACYRGKYRKRFNTTDPFPDFILVLLHRICGLHHLNLNVINEPTAPREPSWEVGPGFHCPLLIGHWRVFLIYKPFLRIPNVWMRATHYKLQIISHWHHLPIFVFFIQ